MSRLSFRLRYSACLIWFVAGILSGQLAGFISSFASLLFLVAMRLDASQYQD